MEESIQFFDTFNNVHNFLRNKNYKNKNTTLFNLFLCNEKIAVKKYKDGNNEIIRIWKTNTFLDIWYTDFPCISNDQFIGFMSYTIEKDSIKINNITLKDFDFAIMMKSYTCLSTAEERELRLSLMHYIIDSALTYNKKKIVIKTHRNMHEYNTIYSDYGFKLTRRRIDNEWFEIEYII